MTTDVRRGNYPLISLPVLEVNKVWRFHASERSEHDLSSCDTVIL
jgi:hypothetical protein